jgi:hypothetical protein
MKPVIAVPAIAALVYRAYSKKSLTPVGILTAFATAIIHVIHPWSVFFALLAVFFVAGSSVTKVSLVYMSLWDRADFRIGQARYQSQAYTVRDRLDRRGGLAQPCPGHCELGCSLSTDIVASLATEGRGEV